MNTQEKLNLIEEEIKRLIEENKKLNEENYQLKSSKEMSKTPNNKSILKKKNLFNNVGKEV